MEVVYSQLFMTDIERIDNVIVIDKCEVVTDEETKEYDPQLVYHDNTLKICLEKVSEASCNRLIFYYGDGEIEAFRIEGGEEKIKLNSKRTLLELSLNFENPKRATIECPGNTEDTKILESIGPDLGSSLYKNIQVPSDSLVWKESLNKYIVDKGCQDNPAYDVELFDTKSVIQEKRAIRFKSYQNIKINQGNWDIDMIAKSSLKKYNSYYNISDESFLIWDSPMVDAKVEIGAEPNCINNLGNYLNPGEVVFGNTDCFQYVNYVTIHLNGFRITGTSGSEVDILFNKEYTGGNYTSFRCTIGEEGSTEVKIPELPYYHFNGIISVGPSRITNIEIIEHIEEWADEYIPNPDKTYNINLKRDSIDIEIPIKGTADYIEYRKYLGKVEEIGRGTEDIDTIPGLIIKKIEDKGDAFSVNSINKSISCGPSAENFNGSPSAVFQVSITNNIDVNGNKLSSSTLFADYKIFITRDQYIWRIEDIPDFVNPVYFTDEDEEFNNIPIFTVPRYLFSQRKIRVITNEPVKDTDVLYILKEDGQTSWDSSLEPNVIIRLGKPEDPGINPPFDSMAHFENAEERNGEVWNRFELTIFATKRNGDGPVPPPRPKPSVSPSWIPHKNNGDPLLVRFKYREKIISPVFHPIQLGNIKKIEIWEELLPSKFCEVKDKITLLNAMTKKFIVVTPDVKTKWYYYDINNTNEFYTTDNSFNITNNGIEYLRRSNEEIINLDTIEDRELYSRVINSNRSDSTGDLGILLVTEDETTPLSWKSILNTGFASVLVTREIDNIYVNVGPNERNMKNEDIILEVDCIKKLSLSVSSNHKYVIQSYGYLKFYPEDTPEEDIIPSESFQTVKNVFTDYSSIKTFELALEKLDLDPGMGESLIEIKAGNIIRRVTLKVVGPKSEHEYKSNDVSDRIRIFNNGSVSTEVTLGYKSTTTPNIEGVNIRKTSEDNTEPMFSRARYEYHESKVHFSINNSKSVECSKYPIDSFGVIRESSLDYSDLELSPLEFPLYMKGKEHYIWCVNNLSGFGYLNDPVFDKEGEQFISRSSTDIYLNANSESEKNIYVVSRYGINNYDKTFITRCPEKNSYVIESNYNVEIKISDQQKIALDEKSQIEYAIPISVKCNVNNNGGNIFLGSLTYEAITTITDDSIGDIIYAPEDVEGIDSEYIKENIITDKTQKLNIRIFQAGDDNDVFKLYSAIPDIGVDSKTVYMIPEVGNNIKITSANLSTRVTGDPYIEGSDTKICSFKLDYEDYDQKYFLVIVDSLDRVWDSSNRHWYKVSFLPDQTVIPVNESEGGLPKRVINDTTYTVNVNVTTKFDNNSEMSDTFINVFKKYGHHYGFYIDDCAGEGYAGFGNYKSEILKDSLDPETDQSKRAIYLPADGGNIVLHAGVFYAIDGLWKTEALMVPKEYKFIGENVPEKVLWEDGNLDDNGNFIITIPPRVRDDYGLKKFVLQITQPHEYYPLNLYVTLCQEPFYSAEPDTGKDNYKLMFLERELNIYSNGKIYGDEKIYFKHNMTHDIFDKVSFGWVAQDGEPEIPTYPDDLTELFEIERSYEEGYVRLRFLPNGSYTFIKALLQAKFENKVIGEVPVNQGYYNFELSYNNPLMEETEGYKKLSIPNYLSRISPKPLRLYYKDDEEGNVIYTYINSRGPCKTNNDNSEATKKYCGGRGVFTVAGIFRKEFYDGEEEVRQPSSIVDSVELINLSPSIYLESSGVSFSFKENEITWDSEIDPDALIVPRYNGNSKYVTEKNFNMSYIEFEYEVKKEYIKDELTLSEACKVMLKDIDLSSLAEFYMSTITFKRASDEIDPFVFKDYVLKYSCDGGTQSILHNPVYNKISITSSTSWCEWEYDFNSDNFIKFTVESNKTSESGGTVTPAYYRTTQFKVNVYDPRCPQDYLYLLGSYYVTIEQEPDKISIVNEEEPEPEPPTPTTPKIKVRFISNISEGFSGEGERDDKLHLNGQIEFYVASPKVSGEYVLVRANLPDYVDNNNKWNLEPYNGSDLPTPPIPPYDPNNVESKSYYSKVYEVEPKSASPSITIEELFGQTIDKFPTWKVEGEEASRDKGGRAYTWVNDGVNNRYYYPYIVVRQDQDRRDLNCLFEEGKLYNIIFIENNTDPEPYRPLPPVPSA